jgi:uncharacterized protein (TIGR02246 family)
LACLPLGATLGVLHSRVGASSVDDVDPINNNKESSMLKRTFLAMICLVTAVSAFGAPAGSGKSDADQIAAATAAWATAYNTRETDQILGAYDNDAMLWGTTATALAIGPTAIREYYKDAPKRPGARVEIGEQHVRVYGDMAVNSGTYTFSDSHEGQHTIRPARFTMVFRHHNSQWFIVAHHSSVTPAP